MSTHEPDQLLALWRRDEIDSEMAIGHMLQNLALHQQALKRLTLVTTQLSAETASLIAQVKQLLACTQ